jgi:hypothetical protein
MVFIAILIIAIVPHGRAENLMRKFVNRGPSNSTTDAFDHDLP